MRLVRENVEDSLSRSGTEGGKTKMEKSKGLIAIEAHDVLCTRIRKKNKI